MRDFIAHTGAVHAGFGGVLAGLLLARADAPLPFFVSTGALAVGLFTIGFSKGWRLPDIAGLWITIGLGAAWAYRGQPYQHAQLAEISLISFFVFYLVTGMIQMLRHPQGAWVDGMVTLAPPLALLVFQALLTPMSSAIPIFTVLLLAALYNVLGSVLLRSNPTPARRDLGTRFAALAASCITLVVPLALSATGIAAVWALEGVALLWLGLRVKRKRVVQSGVVVLGLGLIAYGTRLAGWPPEAAWPVINPEFVVGGFLGACALLGSRKLASSDPTLALEARACAFVATLAFAAAALNEVARFAT